MVEEIKNFNLKFDRKMDATSRILDVQSELGEMCKEILKATSYGKKNFKPTDALVEEFGDVCYSLISFALENGISPEGAVKLALTKYEKRIKDKGNMGSNQ